MKDIGSLLFPDDSKAKAHSGAESPLRKRISRLKLSTYKDFMWAFTHRGKSKHAKGDNQLLSQLARLPTEILLLIFDHLPLVAQACLALTCKIIYEDLNYILKHDAFSFPKPLARQSHSDILHVNRELPRHQLLLKLEDDRWLYCAGCLIIHHKKDFENIFRSRNSPVRAVRRCSHGGGLVDVCPCLVLTYTDRCGLEEWLRTGKPGKLPKRIVRALQRVTTDNKDAVVPRDNLFIRKGHRLVHECRMKTRGRGVCEFLTVFAIGKSKSLELHTSYEVRIPTPEQVNLRCPHKHLRGLEPIFLCPGLNVAEKMGNGGTREFQCDVCKATMKAYCASLEGDKICAAAKGMRDLGKIEKKAPEAWNNITRCETHAMELLHLVLPYIVKGSD